MRSLQRAIVAIGLLAIATSGLYVPWYAWLADRGTVLVIDRGFAFHHALPDGPRVQVDYPAILLRWAVIAAFTGASLLLVSLLPPSSRREKS